MICFPHAKLNIGLSVVAKRTDGYHELETLFYPLPICDMLEIVVSDGDRNEFVQTGLPVPPDGKPNLVERACLLMQNAYGLSPVKIHLHKIIPIGAGLGGGSSDAAFALKMINDIFEMALPEEILVQYAVRLGADCAFFMRNKPSLAYGIGDELRPVQFSLASYWCVVVKPAVHVSTALAYQGVRPASPKNSLEQMMKEQVSLWQGRVVNDFESGVFNQYPQIGLVKETLLDCGAVYASMSGSGSAVYGLFEQEPRSLPFGPDYYIWKGELL